MIRPSFTRLGLQGIRSLFSMSEGAHAKPVHNVVLAKWEDHYDRHPCDASRRHRSNTLSYLTPAD